MVGLYFHLTWTMIGKKQAMDIQMHIHTHLPGRLRNTSLPKTHGLLPVFEAVVNAIHAIEENGHGHDGQVVLEIQRNTQLPLLKEHTPSEITGFVVTDNGIGFNDRNMRSFETLDSDYKIDKGCRGVGRLLWLKAFDSVEVSSVFENPDGTLGQRHFTFDQEGIKNLSDKPDKSDKTMGTRIHLIRFDAKYQASASKKTTGAIARALLEHCLWYFVRPGGVPKIQVRDGSEQVDLHELYQNYLHTQVVPETMEMKGHRFELTHFKFRASSGKKHMMSLCATNRLVKEEVITGKLPGLHGKIQDQDGNFIYACYVSSRYLDERVRSERTEFDIAENLEEIFSNTEISLREIRDLVLSHAKKYLNEDLMTQINAGCDRVNEYVSKQAPRYRPILSHFNKETLAIDPNLPDKDVELHLHKRLTEVEQELLQKGHALMEYTEEDFDDYQNRLNEYLQIAEDIKKSDLASYVSHRRVILDLLEKYIQKTESGKYRREEVIHRLIMPMRKDSNEVSQDACNLWLIDERLAFHHYLASDKSLNSMPITNDTSHKEPDLCGLNVYDNPILVSEKQVLPLASITVIEIKRPMRNDAKLGEEKNPIEQTLSYLEKIRKGGVKTVQGRPIYESQDIPGYCYVICDLTESVKSMCALANLEITSDYMGYFGFNKNFKAYIEVISYDRLLHAAKERNRAFFDKLGLPAT